MSPVSSVRILSRTSRYCGRRPYFRVIVPREFEFDLVRIPYDMITLRSRRVPPLGSRILDEPENTKKWSYDSEHSGETRAWEQT